MPSRIVSYCVAQAVLEELMVAVEFREADDVAVERKDRLHETISSLSPPTATAEQSFERETHDFYMATEFLRKMLLVSELHFLDLG